MWEDQFTLIPARAQVGLESRRARNNYILKQNTRARFLYWDFGRFRKYIPALGAWTLGARDDDTFCASFSYEGPGENHR